MCDRLDEILVIWFLWPWHWYQNQSPASTFRPLGISPSTLPYTPWNFVFLLYSMSWIYILGFYLNQHQQNIILFISKCRCYKSTDILANKYTGIQGHYHTSIHFTKESNTYGGMCQWLIKRPVNRMQFSCNKITTYKSFHIKSVWE